MSRIVHIFLLMLLYSNSVSGQVSGIYLVPPSGFNQFVPASDLYRGPNADNPGTWVKERGGHPMNENDLGWFAVYKIRLLSYWFGPYENPQQCQNTVERLRQLRGRYALAQYRQEIKVTAIFLAKDGRPLDTLSLKDGSTVLVDVEEKDVGQLIQDDPNATKDVLDSFTKNTSSPQTKGELGQQLGTFKDLAGALISQNLSGEGKEAFERLQKGVKDGSIGGVPDGEGDHSSGSGGLKGPFPVSVSFSKWFAMMADILTDLAPGLKEQVMKALTIAYMLMPEVFDQVASALAKLQHSLTPDGLDSMLNNLADVANVAYELYQNLKKIKDLVSNPDFETVVKNVNLKGLDEAMRKVGVNTHLGKLCQQIPCEMLSLSRLRLDNLSSKQLGDIFKKQIKKQAIKQMPGLLKKAGVPGIDNIDFDALGELIEGNIKVDEFGRRQAKKALCEQIPGGYGNACNKLVDGNFQPEAFKDAALDAISRKGASELGINKEELENVLQDLASGKSEEALKGMSDIALDKTARKAGLDPETLKDVKKHLSKGNTLEALRSAAISSKGYYSKYFGSYSDYVQDLLRTKDLKDLQSTGKAALNHFIEKTVDNGIVQQTTQESIEFFDQIILNKKAPEAYMRERLQKAGMDKQLIDAILTGNGQIDSGKILNRIAEEVGLVSPKAIEAFKRGDISAALDAEIEYLERKMENEKGYMNYQRSRMKDKKDLLKKAFQ